MGNSMPAYKTWLLDTAETVTTKFVDIAWIIWTDVTGNGDDLVINDGSGDLIIQLKGRAGIDMKVDFPGEDGGKCQGVILATLSSGKVQVRTKIHWSPPDP